MRVSTAIFSTLICVALCGIGPAASDPGDLPLGPPAPIRPMEMVLVKGGCYQMGSTPGEGTENEQPAHHVCVKDFYLGEYLVTQLEWSASMGNNPSAEAACGLACPVENVSWNDVQEFIRRLSEHTGKSYRLPTEAEWEYAARSRGKSEKWAGTSDEKDLADYAWYYNDSHFKSHPVGMKKPNGLGLYDMTGNVWEWMSDWYDEGYYAKSPTDNPKGPETGRARVLRGGFWGDFATMVRIARRIGLDPAAHAAGFGVRLALPAP